MDVAVVYNFAEHPGGGDLVALDIVEALLKEGYTVSLYTSLPEGIQKALQYFGKDSKIFEDVATKKVEVSKVIKHPYNIYFIMKKALNELKRHDLVIFFDDIPKPAQELKRVLVYVHYPHAARIILNELVPYRYCYSLKGKTLWKLHSLFFNQCFLMNWSKPNILAIVNSTLTQNHVIKALKPMHLTKIYPPVQVEQIIRYVKQVNTIKEDLIAYVGRIQPEKGIDDIIKALALVKNTSVRARIMGFLFDKRCLKHLISLAKSLGVEKCVEIVTNTARETILESLARAKVLIHPAQYEPFGIAVVEGMAASCIPIVRRGPNGPWIDVTLQGRYGLGFINVKELANEIDYTIEQYKGCEVEAVAKRALGFSEAEFRKNFVKIVNKLI